MINDIYLWFGLTIPAPDLHPDFSTFEESAAVNFEYRDDARPASQIDDAADNTMVNFFK